MKKIVVFLFAALIQLSYSDLFAQCSVEAFPADTIILTCGDSAVIELSAFGVSGNFAINNDFNAGNPGTGWDGTLAATYTNPCVDSPDGTIYMWMGDATPQPRILTTQSFDLSPGGTICYEMRYAVQAEAAPCEGPDEPQEGVYLQYSVDNGVNWVTIDYLDPIGGYDPVITSWQQYCHGIPAAAQTADTKIRWFQDATSGAEYDHWGLDNVFISINDPSYSYEWEHDGSTDPEPPMVTAYGDSTFVVSYGNGTTDVCYDTVVVQTVPPLFTVETVADTSICGDGCIELNGVANVLIRPESQPTFENNEFQPLVPFGQPTVISLATGNVAEQTVESGTIESVCLNVNNPALPFPIDMSTVSVELECPDGTSITLIAEGDVSGASLSNMCFSNDGVPLSSGSSPYSGDFLPSSGSMDDFIGCSTNGVWTMTLTNSNFTAFGFFNSWSITFNVPEISYPGVFEWYPTTDLDDPNSINPLACPQTSQTYELMVTDSFECATTTHEVTIGIIDPDLLSVEASVTNANCSVDDGQIELTVIGASGNEVVEWEDGTQGTILADVDSGLYQVTIADGCVLDTMIFVGAQPSELSIEADVLSANCSANDGEVSLTVLGSSGNETIEWEDGTVGAVLTNVDSGFYQVTISDGCILDTLIFIDALPNQLEVEADVTDADCGATNGAIELIVYGSSGNETIEWEDGTDGPTIESIPTGEYGVTVSDGCVLDTTINVGAIGGAELDSLTVAPPLPGSIDGQIEVLASGGTPPLEYSLNNGDFQPSNIFTELDTGTYFITVQDAFGCGDTITISMADFVEVEIPNVFNPNSDFKGNQTFVILGMTEPEVKIYDRWGLKIYESEAYANDWDGGKHADGVFYYIVKNRLDGQAYTGYVHLVK